MFAVRRLVLACSGGELAVVGSGEHVEAFVLHLTAHHVAQALFVVDDENRDS
jgi:hypothetical protein